MPGPQRDKATAATSNIQDGWERPPNSNIFHNSDELDGTHDGLTFPTDEEKEILRRVPDSIPSNVYLLCLMVLAERFSLYGTSALLSDFILQSGQLGMGSRIGLKKFYRFWCFLTPLLGAYIADTYWGRFKTVVFALFVALIGHVILIISAVLVTVDNRAAIVACVVALITIGLGTGLFNANIFPLVAEQYERTKLFVTITNKGERVIVDPALTVSRVYMYLYLFINLDALFGRVMMYHTVKYVGFWLAYMIPTVVLLLCPLVTWSSHRYVHLAPTRSVLSTALRLFRFAARGKWNLNPVKTYKNLTTPDFWDNAKPSKQNNQPEWMNFDDQWVDEVKRGFKACGVFCWFPIYWLTYFQLEQALPSQASTMAAHNIPDVVLRNLDLFSFPIFLSIYILVFYPFLCRTCLYLSALKKITLGFMSSAAAMVWLAVVQRYISKTNPCGDNISTCDTVSHLNVWIQIGSYVLFAFSEILGSITGLEYAFTKAPKNMRSLVISVFFLTSAFATALHEALASLSTDSFLVRRYGALGVLSFITSALFWWTLKDLDAAEDELNNMPAGHLKTERRSTANPIRLEDQLPTLDSRGKAGNGKWQPGSSYCGEIFELH